MSKMTYILKNPDYPEVLIGTAPWIAEVRRTLAARGIVTHDRLDGHAKGLPPWLCRLECLGMIPGDEDVAAALREMFWAETFAAVYVHGDTQASVPYLMMPEGDPWGQHCRAETPWRLASPDLLAWL